MKIILLLFASGLLLLALPAPSSRGQDSSTTVILSDRVGQVIDAKEREYFHLFQQYASFDSATVFLADGKKFFIRVARHTSEGVYADTVVEYNEVTLLTIAEKIDHFEDLDAGRYRIGEQPSTLQLTGGAVFGWANISRPVDSLAGEAPTVHGRIGSDSPPGWWQSYPEVLLGFGVSTNPADLSGLNAVFNQHEASNNVPLRETSFDVRPLLLFSLTVQFHVHLLILFEAGGTFEDPRSASYSVLLAYTTRIPGAEWIRPFVGGCVERNSFKAERQYGSDNLTSVTIQGGEYTGGGRGGAMLMMSRGVGVNISAEYTARVQIPGEPGSVEPAATLGGFRMGAQLFIRL
jgi:hypothetical protein